MLTEQQARVLLHRAADTVEVSPSSGAHIPASRRIWPLAAAATSLVIIVSGVVLTRSGDDNTQPAAPSPTAPDDGRFRLGPDQIPSMFGYSEEDAVDLLQDRGLEVATSLVATAPPMEADCGEQPGRVVDVLPAPGTLVSPGDRVRLEIADGTGGATAYCLPQPMRPEAWALVDFANGRGPSPDVAEGVDLAPVLAKLRDWSDDVSRYEVNSLHFDTPIMSTSLDSSHACGTPPARFRGDDVLAINIEIPQRQPVDGTFAGACHTLLVRYDADGRILDTWVAADPTTSDRAVPPDVVGNSVDFAAQRLQGAGYVVQRLGRADCEPVGLVTAQQPSPMYPAKPLARGSTVIVAFTDAAGPCLDRRAPIETSASRAAEALVEFAKGGQLPPVANTVELYAGNVLQQRISAELAADRDTWLTGCGSSDHCQVNMLDLFRTGHVGVTEPFPRTGDPCHVVHADPPDELTSPDALSRSASFGVPEPMTCDQNWEAQVWLDPDGRIIAVNLLRGDPTALG